MSLNKHKSKGNKIRKISLLVSHIIDKIDNNQNIKRLLVYNTVNPLANRGKEYDGDIIEQPDIEYSLYYTKDKEKEFIVNGTFDIDMKDKLENTIYVHCYSGSYKNTMGRLKIAINILVPQQYEFLANKGDTRSNLIGEELENMFDNTYLESGNCEMVNELGNLKFELYDFTNTRLSKTNTMTLTTIVFDVDILTIRSEGGF